MRNVFWYQPQLIAFSPSHLTIQVQRHFPSSRRYVYRIFASEVTFRFPLAEAYFFLYFLSFNLYRNLSNKIICNQTLGSNYIGITLPELSSFSVLGLYDFPSDPYWEFRPDIKCYFSDYCSENYKRQVLSLLKLHLESR